jgi:ABC-type phosphate transport system auxiliary subunit
MNNAEAKSSDLTKADAPYTNTLSNRNRFMTEEEICAQLLEEVRKDVGIILNEIEDVKIENRRLKHKNKKSKRVNEELKNENGDEIKKLNIRNEKLTRRE